MAFKKDGKISFEVKQDGINELIEEKGNMVTMLRELGWNGRECRLDLRKWNIDVDKEVPLKGISFSTEEGPSNLAEALIKHNYGDTKNVLRQLSARDDFEESLVAVVGKQKVKAAKDTTVIVDEDELYDPKSLIS